MKAYPEYKDSGVPWLEKVPKHWEIKRLGSKFIERREKVSDKDYPPLSVTKNGILPQLANAAKTNDGDNRKRVCAGDFVINSRSDRKGSSGLSNLDGSVSLINTVLQPRDIYSRYVHCLFKSYPFQEEFYRVGRGIVADLWSTQYSEMSTIMIPIPVQDEQHHIARFLDYKTWQINKFIRAKKRMIELLKEQKQCIINDAVTGKIDVRTGKPYPKYKDSGVEWLGQVPEGWEVRRLKSVCNSIIDCKNRTPEYIINGQYFVVRTTCIKGGKFDYNGGYPTDEVNYKKWTQRGSPKKGDVFFTREAPAGEACLVPDENNLCMGQRMMYFRPIESLLFPRFLLWNIYSPLTRRCIEQATNGSTVGHLRLGQVFNLPLLLCDIETQSRIIKMIDITNCKIESVISRIEREISLMQEYRTRLIADVVTGKVDVRGVEVPDVPEEVEMLEGNRDEEGMAEELDSVEEAENE